MLLQLMGTIPAKSTAKFACAVYAERKNEVFKRAELLESVNVPDEEELENFKSSAESS